MKIRIGHDSVEFVAHIQDVKNRVHVAGIAKVSKIIPGARVTEKANEKGC